ncbi:hypothetical protein [Paenibacillus rhizophilus]|uniref:Uncharacterized protein n=1 Tax=Paenibacillus rhizophilus TaxID=1850366 RepID=A0A3N9P157_9BACL|nr:hypothetical protein [Paenibacillus rhizophilus]RQW09931.1 hypothetical protein EH198_17780 [Paenibacillus rhizophilus]
MKAEKAKIQGALQTCLDAGAPLEFLRQMISLFRRKWTGSKIMQKFIDDMEVRYITSMEVEE